MTDIETLEKEINHMLDTLSKDMESMQKKDPSQRTKQVNKCQNKFIEIRTRIEAFELETLQLDKLSQAKYKDSLKETQTRFKELKSKFEKKKAEKVDGHERLVTEEAVEKELLDTMTDKEVIEVGHRVQQKGKDALQRVLGQVESANNQADAINLELARQEETIARAHGKVKDVQSQIKIAKQYIRYFARQVYTDKILLCMIILCVIAIIAIIILKVMQKKGITTAQDLIKNVSSTS